MTYSDIDATVADLRARLDEAEAEQREVHRLKAEDFRTYLGRLIYENKRQSGSYGYGYGDFGQSELERADEVLAVAKGDQEIAEAIVRTFHIR